MPACLEEIDRIYRRLDVKFDHTLGESFYNPMLADVVQELAGTRHRRGERRRGHHSAAGKRPPSLIRKRDGAFTYTTTDLATIQYRMKEWNPDAILYVVDFRQKEHFANLFDAARAGVVQAQLEHVSFGARFEQGRQAAQNAQGRRTRVKRSA